MAADVSVVTPVRDDPELIRAMRSMPPGVQYIVALTQPPESVRRLVSEFCRERPETIVVESDVAGMSAGVNLGTRTATNEKIVILDSDCTLDATTLDAYSRALDHADFVRGVTHPRADGLWATCARLGQEELNRVFAERGARLIGPSIAFRKTAFERLGGYDLAIGGSCDHEFALRVEDAGFATAFDPAAVVEHTAITLRIDVRSHFGYGRGMRAIDVKRGGRYGLGVCLNRLDPRTLGHKLVSRGPLSVVRSAVLGMTMLLGYADRVLAERRARR